MKNPGSRQFLRFALVGAAGFVIDAGVLYALASHLGWYAGRLLSFWAAASATWLLNRHFTFCAVPAAGAATAREYGGYLLAMLGGASLNYAVYLAALLLGTPPLLAVAAGSVAGLVLNFLAARRLVFARRQEPR